MAWALSSPHDIRYIIDQNSKLSRPGHKVSTLSTDWYSQMSGTLKGDNLRVEAGITRTCSALLPYALSMSISAAQA